MRMKFSVHTGYAARCSKWKSASLTLSGMLQPIARHAVAVTTIGLPVINKTARALSAAVRQYHCVMRVSQRARLRVLAKSIAVYTKPLPSLTTVILPRL